jgi:hypothetical protein
MPKKLHSNPKAEAARERKEDVKKTKQAAEVKAAEDAKWVDEGSTATEKRRVEAAQREVEAARKRAEKKALAEKEEADAAAISGKAKGLSNAEKITRAQLLRQAEEAAEARKMEAERQHMEALKLTPQVDLTPNLNRQASEELARDLQQYGAGNVIQASGSIDASLGALAGASSSSTPASMSIGSNPTPKKSGFAEYEERMLPIVRRENPKLKLSQWKQIVFKDWQKLKIEETRRAASAQSLLANTDDMKYSNFHD